MTLLGEVLYNTLNSRISETQTLRESLQNSVDAADNSEPNEVVAARIHTVIESLEETIDLLTLIARFVRDGNTSGIVALATK